MEANQRILEERIHRIVAISVTSQCVAMTVSTLILYFKPTNFKLFGQAFSMTALLGSFILSRIYISAGKELEELKKFTPDEIRAIKQEYFVKFFAPYGLWVVCIWMFS